MTTMTTIEKILKEHGILTTKENDVIIAWDDYGIEEQAKFNVSDDLTVVYKFLGY